MASFKDLQVYVSHPHHLSFFTKHSLYLSLSLSLPLSFFLSFSLNMNEALQGLIQIGVSFINTPMAPAFFTVLGILVGLLGYLYGPYWRVRRVPGPPVLPLVGHLPLMAKYGHDVFSVLAKRYGPIFRYFHCCFLLYFSCMRQDK